MTDDDIRAIVRAIKTAQADEFDSLHRQLSVLESALVNSLRDVGRRIDRLEIRVASLDERVATLESR